MINNFSMLIDSRRTSKVNLMDQSIFSGPCLWHHKKPCQFFFTHRSGKNSFVLDMPIFRQNPRFAIFLLFFLVEHYSDFIVLSKITSRFMVSGAGNACFVTGFNKISSFALTLASCCVINYCLNVL